MVVCICYAVVGIPIYSLILVGWSEVCSKMFLNAYITIKNKKSCKKTNLLQATPRAIAMMTEMPGNPHSVNTTSAAEITDVSMQHDEDTAENANRVPPYILAVTMTVYIAFGMTIFHYWENWNPIESLYFVVISLLSIGFGDYIPAQQSSCPYTILKFLTLIVYLVLGSSLIGMVVRLAQDTAKETFEKFCLKIDKTTLNKRQFLEITEADEEKEKQEIISRVRTLKHYATMLEIRKRII
jgi:hypothetical protein